MVKTKTLVVTMAGTLTKEEAETLYKHVNDVRG